MLLRCNVVNLCIRLQTASCRPMLSANDVRSVRFPQFNSLFDHAKYTCNMAAQFKMRSSINGFMQFLAYIEFV